jgi:hypothetical protein
MTDQSVLLSKYFRNLNIFSKKIILRSKKAKKFIVSFFTRGYGCVRMVTDGYGASGAYKPDAATGKQTDFCRAFSPLT